MNIEINIFRCKIALIGVLSLFLLGVGLFYSGKLYLTHLSDGIAAGVVVDGVRYMLPGDHHEQFYRYSLVYENLIRGRLPYYTGYQYASADFTEGMIFFPFTAIVGLMSFVFGPILSYNLLLLCSYVFVGLAGFYMVRQITKSTVGGVVAAVFLATVPFRTSFLYGQMVYGVDAVMLPLLIYVIERAKETGQAKFFLTVGAVMFMTLTANFQMFYWGMLLLSPYFIYVSFVYFISDDGFRFVKIKPVAWMIPGLLACLAYGLYIYSLMKGSALQSGQDISETLFYTPEFYRLFIKFNGNEKNVYLGLTALFVVPWLLSPLLRSRQAIERSPYISIFLVIFAVGLFLVFGLYIDKALKLPVYQWMFDNIPGFNGTRTPGRIMAVVVVAYAVLLGFAVASITTFFKNRLPKKFSTVFCVGVVLLIVYDFNYMKPGINIFEKENKAYRSIAGAERKVVTLPFQFNSAHYLNSTFLTYALKYDLRLLTGHSSFYPKIVDAQVEKLFDVNSGFIDYNQWRFLRDNDYEYIIAHATQFEPNVSSAVVGALNMSLFLEFVMSDNGVYLYKIRKTIDSSLDLKSHSVDFDRWAAEIEALPSRQSVGSENINYAYGWYSREIYPDQKPFRWMKGVSSIISLEPSRVGKKAVVFDYICPDNGHLNINARGVDAKVKQEKLKDNWTRADVEFASVSTKPVFIVLEAQKIFSVPTDARKFGCQVSDINVRQKD